MPFRHELCHLPLLWARFPLNQDQEPENPRFPTQSPSKCRDRAALSQGLVVHNLGRVTKVWPSSQVSAPSLCEEQQHSGGTGEACKDYTGTLMSWGWPPIPHGICTCSQMSQEFIGRCVSMYLCVLWWGTWEERWGSWGGAGSWQSLPLPTNSATHQTMMFPFFSLCFLCIALSFSYNHYGLIFQ